MTCAFTGAGGKELTLWRAISSKSGILGYRREIVDLQGGEIDSFQGGGTLIRSERGNTVKVGVTNTSNRTTKVT